MRFNGWYTLNHNCAGIKQYYTFLCSTGNTKDKIMLQFFKKDPLTRLNKQYKRLMEEARDIQRSGDLKLYATKISEAENVAKQIDAIKQG